MTANRHTSGAFVSFLDQVEIGFGRIQRDLITRGVFTSTIDLRRKLMSYIRHHNRDCRPFHWTYRKSKNLIGINDY